MSLRKATAGLEMDDWNLDSALLKNFDVIVRRQLDPNWHRVSWKTKQIVGDLTVLRGLLHSVLALDAVSFLPTARYHPCCPFPTTWLYEAKSVALAIP